jgi:hypothetical protein
MEVAHLGDDSLGNKDIRSGGALSENGKRLI